VITPGSFEDIVEHLVPELRRRGRTWDDYPEGTLRGRLSGDRSPVVPEWHPAHAYRGAYVGGASALDGTRGGPLVDAASEAPGGTTESDDLTELTEKEDAR